MNTRSQTNMQIFEVNINFDDASNAWKSNKKSIGNGSYKYICCYSFDSEKKCMREAIFNCEYCKIHKNKINPK
jgi:hypothetical protein